MSEIESDSQGFSPTKGKDSDEDQQFRKMNTIAKIKRDQSVYAEATLKGAKFESKDVFRVKDYVQGGENKHLRRHAIKTGHSW